jgi:hypothetical protein
MSWGRMKLNGLMINLKGKEVKRADLTSAIQKVKDILQKIMNIIGNVNILAQIC